ncbi:hypothetical protein MMC10_005162 [Thelotrema lepadinum]|nr:hypothetical protein [Thelotrema lepadinum]
MTSYLHSLTTHYTSLKRLIPTSLSPDSDNSITDPSDSHVSRVLRAYYTEKGRPFPPWLGPDPNAPVKATPAFASQTLGGRSTPTTASVSSVNSSLSARPGQRGSGGGGLGDLFDDRPASAGNIPDEGRGPLSLRSRKPVLGRSTASGGQQGYQSQSLSSETLPLPSSGRRGAAVAPPQPSPMARPLPSQRLGSYQNRSSESAGSFGSGGAKEQSASERLRARLGGSRAASPAGTPSPGAGFESSSGGGGGGGNYGGFNPYEGSGGGGGGGSFNPYENSGGGGGGAGYNPYETAGSGSRNPHGGSSGGGGKSYNTSANSPWASGDDGGFGYGGDLGSGAGRRGPGLPSNPRRRP